MAGNILIVDDDTVIGEMLETFLKGAGYSVDTAEGVDAALALMKSNDYDIMLIDKNMPGIDGDSEGGLDLLRYVRSQSLSSEVIMLTGNPTVETAAEAFKLGAFDYIPKPFSLDDLRQKIKRLLKYRSFVNPDYAIGIYRSLQGKMLDLIEKGQKMSGDELAQSILSVNDEIDKLFSILKESERIILSERESLSQIALLTEQLKMILPENDTNYNLLEEISRLSNERV